MKANIGSGAFLYDQTFTAAFSDPQVQAAITQARNVLTAAGAASINDPVQLTNNQSLVSSNTATVTTGTQVTSSIPTVASYVGPQTIYIGQLGVCQSYVLNGTSAPTLTGCVPGGTPYNIPAGGINIDTLTLSLVTINQTATTTNTFLTSQVYEIDGFTAGQAPTVTSVVNSYDETSALTPGMVVIVDGTNFGTVAANLSVTVGGKAGYVYPATVAPTQFTMQLPFELSAGPTTLTVKVSGASSNAFAITLVAYAPACQVGSATAAGKPVTLTAPAHPGDQLVISCTGLGPTNPVTATGLATAANSTATLPSVTVSGIPATGVSASVVTGSAGVYQVSFTVPAGDQGTQPVVVSIGGASSSTTFTVALAGLSSLVNNASFANPGIASPGSIATAFANSLATIIDHLSGLFPGTASEGVRLTFNGQAAPMFHLVASTAQQQVDLLVPTELPTSGTVNVQLSTSAATYSNYELTMVPANPGFYRIPDPKVSTRFNVIAQFANTVWLALPASTTTALGLPACTKSTGALTLCGQPAAIGDYLVIYATGLGVATPGGDPSGKALATGSLAPADGSVLYKTPTTPVVTVGGVPANVLFSGLAPGFEGLYQIDIQIPPGVSQSDDAAVKVTMLGASDTATVSVQPRAN